MGLRISKKMPDQIVKDLGQISLLEKHTYIPGEDHVWFEDRWMVASWCDE
jgi:hypothetical protein